jgi:hypothetical protein
MKNERPSSTAPDTKRPYHVGVAVGLTTGIYAISLLATTQMQIATDRALIADRAPVATAIDALDQHHDLQEARLLEARLQYQDGTAGYDAVAERLAILEARLAAVGRTVGKVERLSDSLPGSLSLGSMPTTVARGGGSGSSSGGGHQAIKLPPPPPPKAAPPPASGGTGASGKP